MADYSKIVLKALIDSHLAAARTLQGALQQLEQQEREEQEAARRIGASERASPAGRSRYLDPAQAAELLHMSRSTMDKLRCIGGGPPFRKFGRKILYEIGDLEAWAAAHQRFSSTSNADSLCTIKEACGILKISQTKMYGLINDGALSVVKIGKGTRIRRSDLDRIIGEALRE